MEGYQTNNLEANNAEDENLKYILYKYLRYWPWFLISVLIFLLVAVLYLKYATPIYRTTSEVKILKDDEGGIDLSGLSNTSTLFNYNKVNLENEIQIFKSKRLQRDVIRKLNLNTSYYEVSSFEEELLFGENVPFKVEWLRVDYSELEDIVYEVNFKNDSVFTLYNENKDATFTYSLRDTINKFSTSFILKPKISSNTNLTNSSYKIVYHTEDKLLNYLAKNLIIEPIGDKSDILRLSINGPNRYKNEAIVNTLIDVFNLDGIEDNRLISKRTKEFVEERLELLVQDLDTVESGLVEFKEKNDVVTVESSVEELFNKEASSEAEKFKIETQLALANDFEELLKSQTEYDLLPANLGIESKAINELTNKYNELIIEKNRLLVSSTEENPVVLKLNDKLEQLKNNILVSLDSYLKGLRTSYARLKGRENQYSGEINSLPQKEKELKTILRQQGIKERLYLFLLQKREEAALSYAITSPTIKIVDYAYTNTLPVAPRKKIIILAGLMLGLLLPFGVLYLKFLFKTSVENREDLENYLERRIPIIGEIPLLAASHPKLITKSDQSILAESFRIVRTNIISQFKRNGAKHDKVIFVTSSIKGEGKTFTALNLSKIFSSFSKKVLLIGCDLRNPQIHQYFEINKNIPGLSDFLNSNSSDFSKYIQQSSSHFENLDILYSGSVPPNPAELLLKNDKFSELIRDAREAYDYIIVDTAPTVYVTDSLLISDNADVTVYMVKQDMTDKKLIDHIKNLNKDNKLNNISIVLNGVKNDVNYGYGYGYASDDENKDPFWKFW